MIECKAEKISKNTILLDCGEGRIALVPEREIPKLVKRFNLKIIKVESGGEGYGGNKD